jgi:hypothetical protein
MKNLNEKIILCIFLVALLTVCTFKADSQKAEFGVRLMPTISSFDVTTSTGNTVKGDIMLGYGVGALLGFFANDHVGIQGEVIYSSLSQKYKEQDVERKINLRYFNIPLLLSLNTGKSKLINLNFVAGPQIGISVGSSFSTSGGDGASNTNAVLAVKKGDLGFAYGGGLDFGINPLRTVRVGMGFRGVIGLIDISDNSQTTHTDSYYILDNTKIKTYSAYIGLSIIF